ncbi:MAG: APC family permease, partial [Solirubrobacteraceae bacterium]
FWILLAILSAIAFLDIRISTRLQLVVSVIGALAIVAAMLIILAKGGDAGVSLQPFNPANVPSAHDYFLSMVFAFTGFIGFEAATALGVEAAEPLRVIARAVLAAVLVGLVFYVFVTFSMSIGFGIKHAAAWGQDPTALDTLATRYSGSGLAVVVDLAVMIDAFVAALAGVHLAARITFAMAEEGGLPKLFAWTHPRFRTPWFGIAGVLLLTIALVVWLAYETYNPLTYFGFMATTASLGLLFTYMLVSLGGIVYFWRERRAGGTRYNPILDLLLPLGAIVICGLTIYWSNVPRPPHPIDLAPWISAGWFVLGLIVLAFLTLHSPARVRAFGHTLAEADLGPLQEAGARPESAGVQ